MGQATVSLRDEAKFVSARGRFGAVADAGLAMEVDPVSLCRAGSMTSAAAIPLLVSPRAIELGTSVSRGLSG
jgi:hypothetical protein